MEAFRSLMSFLMTPVCYEIFFTDFNFLDVPCLKAVISKCLGYGIIMGAVLVKVPQIQKLLKSSSAVGMSFSSVLLELYAITSMCAYSIARSFPFSAWGDSFFLLIQVTIIACLVQYYRGKPQLAIVFLVIYSVILFVLVSGITPTNVLAALQASNMPAIVIAKMIQAAESIKNGHTGQLSAITVFLTFIGSTARIFTSIQETGDNIVILTYIVSTIANAVISFQIIYYWKATEEYVKNSMKKQQ
ncbi:mannose-P-dolichol utilization defect 1 protein-like [Styela clava]